MINVNKPYAIKEASRERQTDVNKSISLLTLLSIIIFIHIYNITTNHNYSLITGFVYLTLTFHSEKIFWKYGNLMLRRRLDAHDRHSKQK